MMDLDFFKELNDHFGHEYGDRVLVATARIMQSSLRAECDILARYGGEEFIVLLPDQTLESAQKTAQRLCNAVHQSHIPCPPCGETQNVSISIGVAATLPDGAQHATDLLRDADTQLYLAKDAGRNRIHPPLKPEIPN
jgi:diguanylate cyclase (GGDEF)-like protein